MVGRGGGGRGVDAQPTAACGAVKRVVARACISRRRESGESGGGGAWPPGEGGPGAGSLADKTTPVFASGLTGRPRGAKTMFALFVAAAVAAPNLAKP